MTQMFETALFYGLRIFSSVFEILLAFLLMEGFFKYKFSNKWGKRAAFVACSAAILALQETGGSGELKQLAEIVLIFVISMLLYEGKLKIKIIYNAVFFISVLFSGLLSTFTISQFIDKIEFIEHTSFFYRILCIELSNGYLFLLVMLISMFVKTKKKSISFRYWIMLLSVPITTLITLTVYQYYMEQLPPGEEINAYIIVSSLGLVFINLLVFTLFGKLQNQMEIRRSQELMRMQVKLEGESYKQLEESYSRTRALRHDLKNHLRTLRGLAEHGSREALLDYLDTMTDAVEESTYVSVSGNSAVDAVLNEKMITAQRNMTATQFNVCPLAQTTIPAMDLCVILSNALDNACEACARIESPENRYVRLKITCDDDSVYIVVENPVDKAPKTRAGAYVTSKSDSSEHGLGLKNIKTTAEKHGGSMVTKFENGVFTLVVELHAQ